MTEAIWPNGPLLREDPEVFPTGTDSILLADFARPGPNRRVLDLGSGSGILSILLLHGRPSLTATAVELQPQACRLGAENFRLNHMEDRVRLIQGDLRDYRSLLSPGSFDLTISNPPYFSEGTGKDARLKNARGDGTCRLSELCKAAAWATRWGGSFFLTFRPERLCDLFVCLRSTGFEPKRLRPVLHSPSHPVSILLLEARRGGRSGLTWEAPLFLHTSDGRESPELRRIYHRP